MHTVTAGNNSLKRENHLHNWKINEFFTEDWGLTVIVVEVLLRLLQRSYKPSAVLLKTRTTIVVRNAGCIFIFRPKLLKNIGFYFDSLTSGLVWRVSVNNEESFNTYINKPTTNTIIQRVVLGWFLAPAAFVKPTMLVFFQKSSYHICQNYHYAASEFKQKTQILCFECFVKLFINY